MLQQRFLAAVDLLTADSDTESNGSAEEEMHVVAAAALSFCFGQFVLLFHSRIYRMRDVILIQSLISWALMFFLFV